MPEVRVVLTPYDRQVGDKVGADHRRQRRGAILVALSCANDDLIPREINVLHPESCALEKAPAGSVQQDGHETVSPPELSEDRTHLVTGQDHRQAGGPLGTDDVVEPGQILA
jgi:hypothetical protein